MLVHTACLLPIALWDRRYVPFNPLFCAGQRLNCFQRSVCLSNAKTHDLQTMVLESFDRGCFLNRTANRIDVVYQLTHTSRNIHLQKTERPTDNVTEINSPLAGQRTRLFILLQCREERQRHCGRSAQTVGVIKTRNSFTKITLRASVDPMTKFVTEPIRWFRGSRKRGDVSCLADNGELQEAIKQNIPK